MYATCSLFPEENELLLLSLEPAVSDTLVAQMPLQRKSALDAAQARTRPKAIAARASAGTDVGEAQASADRRHGSVSSSADPNRGLSYAAQHQQPAVEGEEDVSLRNFLLESCETLLPHLHDTDGFFIAVLTRVK